MPYSSAVEITATPLARSGVTMTTLPTTPDGTNGNKFRYDPKAWLEVNNGSGAQITVTFETPRAVDGQAVEDLAVNVPAGARVAIGPFTQTFQQSDGFIWATFSAVASVTIGAFRVP
jgi:hypothetical protein